MVEPIFTKWADLFPELKLAVISKMNYKTRRALRSCSHESWHLVEMFPYRKQLFFQLDYLNETKMWSFKYRCGCPVHEYARPHASFTFEKFEGALDRMKQVIDTAETVVHLQIDSELTTKIKVRDGIKLLNLKNLTWNFYGKGNNGARMESLNFLFDQINLTGLKNVMLAMNNLASQSSFMQHEDFFELERTSMNLEKLWFDGIINDERLLGIRAKNVVLVNGASITPSGFVMFIQKHLKQPSPQMRFAIFKLSFEQQFYLFGALYTKYHGTDIAMVMNSPRSSLKLKIKFNRNERVNNIYNISVYVEFFPAVKQRNRRFANDRAIRACPRLLDFISAVSAELPLGFLLMNYS